MNALLKSVFATSLLALSLSTAPSSLAYAGEPVKPTSFDASVFVTQANKIRLSVEKTTSESLMITLRQVNNNTPLYSGLINRRQTKAAYQFDVDQLVDGIYELEIKSASGCIIKQINIGATAAVVAAPRLLAIH